MASQPVPDAVIAATKNTRLRESMLLGSALEGGWGPNYPVGDSGTSFGPYQMHQGGLLDSLGLTPQQAENAKTATQAMLPVYSSAVNQMSEQEWTNNPQQAAEQSAVIAERPAQDYYSSQGAGAVNAAWANVSGVLSGKSGQTGMPSGQEATLTSAGDSSGWNPLNWIGDLGSLLMGNPVPIAAQALDVSGFKSILERIGLVIFGGLLVLVGIIILGMPAAQKGAKLAAATTAQGRAVGVIGAAGGKAKAADIARRQGIADRSLAIGEKKVAIQASRERRLGGNP